ncbi:hypothetical protein [uncultured Anaerococcus sp.]|uniref:hypothetical protein n=1 Tax=uncultured Anaerococcus sp. TaxID=293428 RepID=UPI00261898B1|nr:hypothetical protein [uncultured Anaerococcus sp.]
MKNNKKIIAASLAISFTLLSASQSFAAVNKNSAFYYSNKTRNAYVNLTDSQRVELDRMNTDNNKVLTLEEVIASGKFSFPIRRGVDWIYPFMIDRDGDGLVGENYVGESGSTSTKTNNSTSDNKPYTGLISSTNDQEESTEKELLEESTASKKENVDKSKAPDIESLKQAVEKAKITLRAVDFLFERTPNFAQNNGKHLNQLATESRELIRRAEAIIAKY